MKKTKANRQIYVGLGALQAFIGLGAVGGGFMLVRDPSGAALGLPLNLLEGSPFPDFMIPGLFLLLVNGGGSLMGAGFSFTRRRYARELAVVLGAILVAWIVIQVGIIGSVHWLHVLYFILGILELGIGLSLGRHRFQAD